LGNWEAYSKIREVKKGMKMTHLISVFIKALKVIISRLNRERIQFSKEYVNKTLMMEDGKKFQVIRDLRVDSINNQAEPVALFTVRFKFSGLPLAINKRLSMIPAPFLMANMGFREKVWCVGKDGYFQGIYQWASKESAESYPDSLIFKIMTRRSAKGTLSYKVIPDTVLSTYIEKLIK